MYSFIDILFIAGRLIFGGFFVLNGWNHFRNTEALAGYAASRGIPSPRIAVWATGALIGIGGLGVILGIYPEISLSLISVFLLGVSFKMHAYWKDTDPAVQSSNKINFQKNLALLGAALMLLSLPVSLEASLAPSAWPFPVF